MQQRKDKTAILFFTLSSKEELKRKQSIKKLEVFDFFISQTLSEIKKSKIPYFVCTEKEQKGNSFGEKFSNAISEVLQQGFSNVITIGNDCPSLNAAILIDAKFHLENGTNVLGLNQNGGLYLCGIRSKQFNKTNWARLSWETTLIAEEVITTFAENSEEIYFLKELNEVNNAGELLYLYTHLKIELPIEVLRFLNTYFRFSASTNYANYSILNCLVAFVKKHNKGSPISVST